MMLAFETNPLQNELLKTLLLHEGYQAEVYANEAALVARCKEQPDAMLLLGTHDCAQSLALVQRVREVSKAPLAVIAAVMDEDAITRHYELGVDEVLLRPLCPERLVARLRNMRRRAAAPGTADTGEEAVSVGPIKLYPALLRLHKADQVIHLTPLQSRLLYCLMVNAGQIVSKTRLEDKVWGYQGEAYGNPLKTHVFHLRQKLE